LEVDGNQANQSDGGDNDDQCNIYIEVNSDDNLIENCYVHDAFYTNIKITGAQTNRDRVMKCVCTNADQEYGIRIYDGEDHVVAGNLCGGNGLAGIGFFGIDRLRCYGNHSYGNTENGIILQRCHNSTVTGNNAYNNTLGGINLEGQSGGAEKCDFCSITGNTSHDNGQDGIQLWQYSVDCTVVGNVCENNSGSGIEITTSCTYNIVNGNRCTGNTSDGITVGTNCDNNLCLGNILNGNSGNAYTDNSSTTEFSHNVS
jgi:parallel beta-helix repeat protein